ncbi:hypothetical protein CCACVL1_01111 [Corchorus capsularis]|uniref:Uncharacterized protein n=1 Tax=Corchorus capsularis TaxID=210143 RepID=A0A1R3KMW0_COCAP|nr:hypothetical protein CCACVL1_01111 [Corchorus capsularis]
MAQCSMTTQLHTGPRLIQA